jgi:copper(I)-binding protein
MKPRALLSSTLATSLICAAGLLGLGLTPAAQAANQTAANPPSTPASNAATTLSISNGWVRWLPNGLPQAGYLTLTNNGEQSIDLLGASSPDFGDVMLHQSIGNGSTMRMVMVDKLTIPAHGKVDIAPGGYHLMLMAATHPIAPGGAVQMVLKFSDGRTLTTSLPVRSAGGQ